jgi:uncharacterized protein (TIGR03086 family)
MDNLALLQRVVDEATRLVDGTGEDQLGDPTPCSDWTVRDLINHITGGAEMFALSVEHGSVPDDELGRLLGGDNLAAGVQESWAMASKKATAAFNRSDAMSKTVTLPFGVMPAPVALDIAVFDVATHVCDLARATGQTVEDQAVLELALEIGRRMVGPDLRQPGLFDEEQPVGADAPVEDRLLAFAGRSVG